MLRLFPLLLATVPAAALVCSAPGSGWGSTSTAPVEWVVTDLDTATQAAGGEPGIVLKPVINISSSSFSVPDPLYNSVSGWVTAMPRDAEWPWSAAHLGCRWPLGDGLAAGLRTFGGAAPDCDAAAGEWLTTEGVGMPETTYNFKVEVVLCFSELAPSVCDEPVAGLGSTWQAPAYDSIWTATWWAQVMPGHARLSVCRRLWQTNVLVVTADAAVTNTVTDLVAFGDATVDINHVYQNGTHTAATAALQLGSAHFTIYGERSADGASYTPIDVDAGGAYVMNFADRHRFTFALVDEAPDDATDVLAAVTAAYDRADVVYDWRVRDHQNATNWLDASERYTIAPFYYAASSFVQAANTNNNPTPTITTRSSADVTTFVIEDTITHSGVFIEDDVQLHIVLTWSAASARRRLARRLAAGDSTTVALTIAFTAAPQPDVRDQWPLLALATLFIVGIVVWRAVATRSTQYHRI